MGVASAAPESPIACSVALVERRHQSWALASLLLPLPLVLIDLHGYHALLLLLLLLTLTARGRCPQQAAALGACYQGCPPPPPLCAVAHHDSAHHLTVAAFAVSFVVVVVAAAAVVVAAAAVVVVAPWLRRGHHGHVCTRAGRGVHQGWGPCLLPQSVCELL